MFLNRSDRYELYLHRKNRRRRRAVFLLAAVLLLLAIADRRGPAHPAHHPRPVTTTTPAPKPRPTAPAKPTAVTSAITWHAFHGIELPVSAGDGPRHESGGLARGFADTRTGAVLAAVNITVRTAAQWGPAVYAPTIRTQVTGTDASILLRADAAAYAAMRTAPPGPAPRGHAVVTAWRLESWSPVAAPADIATASTNSRAAVVTAIRLAWQHGDWRVLAPPGGTWASSAAPAANLAGFTPFPDRR